MLHAGRRYLGNSGLVHADSRELLMEVERHRFRKHIDHKAQRKEFFTDRFNRVQRDLICFGVWVYFSPRQKYRQGNTAMNHTSVHFPIGNTLKEIFTTYTSNMFISQSSVILSFCRKWTCVKEQVYLSSLPTLQARLLACHLRWGRKRE